MKGTCLIAIISLAISIMLLFIAADTHAGPLRQIGRGLGKKIGQKIVDDVRKDNAKWKQERRKVQRETCKLFKDLLIRKKILRQDLDIIEDFIDSRLPRDWMPRQWYRSDLERIGFKLIDPSLTIVDYEYLKDLFNRIWNTHPNRPWWEIIWNRFGEYGRRNYYRPPLPGGIAL